MSQVELVPTIEVVGPAGRVVINRSELSEWQSKGFQPVEPEQPVEQPPSDGGTEGDE